MRVSVVRGGGFAGLVTTVSVDAGSLAPDQANELENRVRDAGVLDLPAGGGGGTDEPDRFTYEVTVDDGTRTHVVRLSEGSMPEKVRSLIDWVTAAPGRTETIGPPGTG